MEDLTDSGIAPHLTIVPKSIRLTLGKFEFGHGPNLRIAAVVGRFDRLYSDENRDLRDIEWDLFIGPAGETSPWVEKHQGIGTVTYSAEHTGLYDIEPEGISAWAQLPQDQMDLVLAALRSSVPLQDVSLSILGMEYGSAPEGRDKVWNISKHETVVIKSLSLNFAHLEERITPEGDALPPPTPVSTEDIERATLLLATKVDAINSTIRWLLAGTIAIAAIVLLK